MPQPLRMIYHPGSANVLHTAKLRVGVVFAWLIPHGYQAWFAAACP